jgi:hypothetical protein
MNRHRAEIAIRERTMEMLGLPRSKVDVVCWDGDDGIYCTSIYLGVPIGGIPSSTVCEYIRYLDGFAPSDVKVCTKAQLPPIEIRS